MASDVFFINMRANIKENFMQKLVRLMSTAGVYDVFSKEDIVAVKIHFGELGNAAFIRPIYIRRIVEVIKEIGASPFLTDTNTLYSGTRSDAPSHLVTAVKNGFSPSVVEAPLIIADGLRGKSETVIETKRRRLDVLYLGKEIVEADAILSVAHFKGHELAGFGGTIKNLGMGCASRKGKLEQHSSLAPKIITKRCIGCSECLKHCSQNAIEIDNNKAEICIKKCIKCGECVIVCPNKAVKIKWNKSISLFMEKMVEYTDGVMKRKKDKSLFLNFITDVSPDCDCHPTNDAPIVKNIGVLCSRDPVAIDQASVDIVNNEIALDGTRLKINKSSGEDKFRGMYPNVDWKIQLKYAEEIHLGVRKYNLIEL